MAEISQTETEIKIILKSLNIRKRSPDVVLLPNYVKFNCPPIFFDGHLTQEIDESKSTFKIFKKEYWILLHKKNEGIWERIFEEFPNKTEALEKRKEMVDKLQSTNQERSKKLLELYDAKKKNEISREIERETEARTKIEMSNTKIVEEELGMKMEQKEINYKNKYKEVKDDTNVKSIKNVPKKTVVLVPPLQPIKRIPLPPKNAVRSNGKIKINFTKFGFKTPKRESQETWQAEVEARRLQAQLKIV